MAKPRQNHASAAISSVPAARKGQVAGRSLGWSAVVRRHCGSFRSVEAREGYHGPRRSDPARVRRPPRRSRRWPRDAPLAAPAPGSRRPRSGRGAAGRPGPSARVRPSGRDHARGEHVAAEVARVEGALEHRLVHRLQLAEGEGLGQQLEGDRRVGRLRPHARAPVRQDLRVVGVEGRQVVEREPAHLDHVRRRAPAGGARPATRARWATRHAPRRRRGRTCRAAPGAMPRTPVCSLQGARAAASRVAPAPTAPPGSAQTLPGRRTSSASSAPPAPSAPPVDATSSPRFTPRAPRAQTAGRPRSRRPSPAAAAARRDGSWPPRSRRAGGPARARSPRASRPGAGAASAAARARCHQLRGERQASAAGSGTRAEVRRAAARSGSRPAMRARLRAARVEVDVRRRQGRVEPPAGQRGADGVAREDRAGGLVEHGHVVARVAGGLEHDQVAARARRARGGRPRRRRCARRGCGRGRRTATSARRRPRPSPRPGGRARPGGGRRADGPRPWPAGRRAPGSRSRRSGRGGRGSGRSRPGRRGRCPAARSASRSDGRRRAGAGVDQGRPLAVDQVRGGDAASIPPRRVSTMLIPGAISSTRRIVA